jgi:hypothetical protein
MTALIACEESQEVCKAFRVLDPSGGLPNWHIKGDAIEAMYSRQWDLVIAFPPCTDLAVSGARWFPEKRANGNQQRSIELFMKFADYDGRIAIENPIGIMSTLYRKPDQIIQPWQFGHGETKATCLWLKGLPLLTPTNIVEGREGKVWRMPPGPDRAKNRSKTFPGVAAAMAEQWG